MKRRTLLQLAGSAAITLAICRSSRQ